MNIHKDASIGLFLCTEYNYIERFHLCLCHYVTDSVYQRILRLLELHHVIKLTTIRNA